MPQLAIVSKMRDEERAACLALLPAGWSLLDCSHDRDVLARAGGEVEIVFGNVRPFELPKLPKLRWVQATWAGIENLLFPEMIERGVQITNVRGAHATAMSEHVMAGLLALGRDLPSHLAANAASEWRRRPQCRLLADSTVLLLGTGAIAAQLIPRLLAFGCKIIGVNSDGRAVQGCERCLSLAALEQDPPAVDFVVSLLPATPQTRALISRAFIEAAPQAFGLVNCSRGAIVDESALLAALDTGTVFGAVLDVTEPEPPAADCPLFHHPRVILTGHNSGAPRLDHRPFDTFLDNLRRWFSHQSLHCLVDPASGY